MVEVKSLDAPDETRSFENGKADIVKLGSFIAGRATLQPGWRWSEHVKPIAGTDSCQVHHKGFVVSGRLHIVMNDGTEGEAASGDAFDIPPGHDAWVLGEDPWIGVDFSEEIAGYAKPS